MAFLMTYRTMSVTLRLISIFQNKSIPQKVQQYKTSLNLLILYQVKVKNEDNLSNH